MFIKGSISSQFLLQIQKYVQYYFDSTQYIYEISCGYHKEIHKCCGLNQLHKLKEIFTVGAIFTVYSCLIIFCEYHSAFIILGYETRGIIILNNPKELLLSKIIILSTQNKGKKSENSYQKLKRSL